MRRLRRYYVPSGSGVAPHGCGALYKKADVDARIEALEAALVRADFLIDRINDWTPDNLTDENCTGWLGHVEPALTAYRQARDATR